MNIEHKHKPRLELIEITEYQVYGSGDWRAGITCRDEDGDRWVLRATGDSITDVARESQRRFEDSENWDSYGFMASQ